MARSRAQRRTQTIFIGLAVLITLLVLLFARDINTSAHQASSPRRSENLSFATLANSSIQKQNNFDSRLSFLLQSGSNLSRPVFAARLEQLALELPKWETDVQLLKNPTLAHHINSEFVSITESRIGIFTSVIRSVSNDLELPGITLGQTTSSHTSLTSLTSLKQKWDHIRFGLRKEPGRAQLIPFTNLVGSLHHMGTISSLRSSATLRVTRGIGIAAVSVHPSPLPASQGVLLLAPVARVNLGVSVLNASFVDQPVTMSITFQPSNGKGFYQSQTLKATIGPNQAYGFLPKSLKTKAGQRATLTISVDGAPGAAGMTRTKVYTVVMSPSGNNS